MVMHVQTKHSPINPPNRYTSCYVLPLTTSRLIEFKYQGRHRTAEPHDYGIINRVKKLLPYQVRVKAKVGGFGLAMGGRERDHSGGRTRGELSGSASRAFRKAQYLGLSFRQCFGGWEGPMLRRPMLIRGMRS